MNVIPGGSSTIGHTSTNGYAILQDTPSLVSVYAPLLFVSSFLKVFTKDGPLESAAASYCREVFQQTPLTWFAIKKNRRPSGMAIDILNLTPKHLLIYLF